MKLVTSRLESARIPYMLTGSVAMAVCALPRMTRDVGLVVDCVSCDAHRICDMFAPDCYADEAQVHEAVAMRTMFDVIHNRLLAKADFMIKTDEPYRETEFGRRIFLRFYGSDFGAVELKKILLHLGLD